LLVSNKADIRKSGGIKALVKLLDSPDPDVKKSAALALSCLLDDCIIINLNIVANRTEIRAINGINPLLDLISCEYLEVQEYCLQCILRCSEDSKTDNCFNIS
jgi:hypothetical protein